MFFTSSVLQFFFQSTYTLQHLFPGSKRERQSSEVLTMLLQALKNIVMSNELPVLTSLVSINIIYLNAFKLLQEAACLHM